MQFGDLFLCHCEVINILIPLPSITPSTTKSQPLSLTSKTRWLFLYINIQKSSKKSGDTPCALVTICSWPLSGFGFSFTSAGEERSNLPHHYIKIERSLLNMGLIIILSTLYFGANPPSEAFMTFLWIYLIICIVLAIIAEWKEK